MFLDQNIPSSEYYHIFNTIKVPNAVFSHGGVSRGILNAIKRHEGSSLVDFPMKQFVFGKVLLKDTL